MSITTQERPIIKAILLTFLLACIAFYNPNVNVAALSEVSGLLSENTWWTASNSPYVITNDVIVTENARLTIEARVEVRFNGNFSLIVNGSMEAIGTQSDPIVFTSDRAQPAPGDWNTIRFQGNTTKSFTAKYVTIEYATNGLTIKSEGRTIVEKSEVRNSFSGIQIVGKSNTVIQRSTITQNTKGITTMGNTTSGIFILNNSIVDNSQESIFLYTNTTSPSDMYVQNVTISGNIISKSQYAIRYFGKNTWSPYQTYFKNVLITENNISSNDYGIHIYNYAYSVNKPEEVITYISNTTISSNIIAFHKKHAIYIESRSAWYNFLFDVKIQKNRLSSNYVGVELYAPDHHQLTDFDATISGNIITSSSVGIKVNSRTVTVNGPIRANITGNSIAYNEGGIFINGSTGNLASLNDIFRNNNYGMTVINSATVNAENNYWGDPTGPRHDTLNPSGKGDTVNGNGADLDYQPFLLNPVGLINERPVARLQSNKPKVATNQTVTIDASLSTDDQHVEQYLFFFGDGVVSALTPSSVATHVYATPDEYTVDAVVFDDWGVASNNTASITIKVIGQPVALFATASQNGTLLQPRQSLAISVHVTDGDFNISNATVSLASDKGGTFSSPSGLTDLEGFFHTVFSIPSVTTETLLTITINTTKEEYVAGRGTTQVILMPSTQGNDQPANQSGVFVLILISIILVIALVIVLRKKF